MSPDAAIRVQRKIGEQLDFPKKPSSDNRELTNRRLSHDAVARSRHISAFCRNLNLRFVVKTTTLVRAAANFPAVSEVCFLLFTSKLVCSTKMSKFMRETRARIADAYGNRFRPSISLYLYFYAFRQQTQS